MLVDLASLAMVYARRPGPEAGFLLNKAKARARPSLFLKSSAIWAQTQAQRHKLAFNYVAKFEEAYNSFQMQY